MDAVSGQRPAASGQQPAASGQWLYFRVLGEPNPERGGERRWRLTELRVARLR